jgi:hypothetical protein
VLGPLEGAKANRWTRDRVGVSSPSPEDGTRPSFRNEVFPIYLEFRTMDKVNKHSGYTPSS